MTAGAFGAMFGTGIYVVTSQSLVDAIVVGSVAAAVDAMMLYFVLDRRGR